MQLAGRARLAQLRAGLRGVASGLVIAVALGALSACSGGDDKAAASASHVEASLAAELVRVERAARGHPAALELRLRETSARLPAQSVDLLQTLALRGQLAAMARDRALSSEIAAQLRDWPKGDLRDAAQVAATLVDGLYLVQRGDMREANKLFVAVPPAQLEKALPVFRWRFLVEAARTAGNAGTLDVALAQGLAALRLAESLGQHWRVSMSLLELAQISQRADTLARARQLVGQALAEAQQDPDPLLLNQVFTMAGIIASDEGDTSTALQAFSDALDQANRSGSESVRALALANFADYHLRQRHPTTAIELAEQALPLARASGNTSAEAVARFNIGLARIQLGRVAQGSDDVRAGITLDEQQGALPSAAEGWLELAGYLEKAGALGDAVAAHREYRRVIAQVLRDDTRKALLEAQERYDAEQRARDIELANRDNALKSEQLSQRNLALGLWAALGGCALVSAGLLVLAFKRVRRANEALAITNATLKLQSESDPLTGLANRRHFQAAIKTLARPDGLEASVLLIDVDHFKRINDAYGHAAGDQVLVEIAARLRSAVREDDLVVRWGGEEFLIVVRTSEPAFARSLAQRLLDLIGGQPVLHEGRSIRVSASIGFVSLPIAPHGLRLPWERAIDLVDTVMYLAKAHGRNKAYGVERINAQDAHAAAQLTARLEAAWAEGEVGLLALAGPGQTQAVESGFFQSESGAAL